MMSKTTRSITARSRRRWETLEWVTLAANRQFAFFFHFDSNPTISRLTDYKNLLPREKVKNTRGHGFKPFFFLLLCERKNLACLIDIVWSFRVSFFYYFWRNPELDTQLPCTSSLNIAHRNWTWQKNGKNPRKCLGPVHTGRISRFARKFVGKSFDVASNAVCTLPLGTMCSIFCKQHLRAPPRPVWKGPYPNLRRPHPLLSCVPKNTKS